jgi:hypothetical protein
MAKIFLGIVGLYELVAISKNVLRGHLEITTFFSQYFLFLSASLGFIAYNMESKMSILDYEPQLPEYEDSGPEPSLREMIWRYYHYCKFFSAKKEKELTEVYCRLIEERLNDTKTVSGSK